MRQWSILRAISGREKTLAERIEAKSIPTFLPMRLAMISHARKISFEPRPLFPGHLFVSLDSINSRWHEFQRLPGALSFIRFGPSPSVVRPGVIEALQSAVNSGEFNDKIESPLGVGEIVQIKSGPFANLFGRIARVDPKSRNYLILELLEKDRAVGGVRVVASVYNLQRKT